MITPPVRSGLNLPAVTRGSAVRSASNSFKSQFDGLATSRVGISKSRTDAIAAPARNANSVTVPRQNTVTTSGSIAVPTVATSTGARTASAVNGRVDTQSALQLLMGKLREAGVDPGALGLYGHDDQVWYPGGGYTNNEITATIGSQTINFDAYITSMSPSCVVEEIKNAMKAG